MREDNGGAGTHEGRPYGDAEGEREESVIGNEIPRLGFAAFGMAGGGTGNGFPHSREQRGGGGYMWVGAVMPIRVRQRWRATRAAAVSLRRAAVSSWSAGSLDKTRQFS